MKKLLSILMIFVLLIVIAPMAFATGEVTGVTITQGDSVSATVDTPITLTATVSPDTAPDKSVTWSSDNTAVATVSTAGVVTPVSAGTANITVTTVDGSKTATCAVTVTIPVTGVTLNKTTNAMAPSSTFTLTASVSPDTASNKTCTWASDNTAVASLSVSADTLSAVVTAGNEGTAKITVTTKDGSKTATCTVVVADSTKIVSEPEVTNYVYDGSAHCGIPDNDAYDKSGNTSETEAQTAAYSVTATLKSGYVWSDGTTDPKAFSWRIDRKPIAVPTANAGLIYNGSTQTGVNPDDAKYSLTNYEKEIAGDYTATATPKANYCWNDSTYTAKNISWSIAKKKITPPDTSKTEYAYTGSDIKPIAKTDDYNVSYPALIKDVGEYSTTISLADTDNTIWTTGSSDAINFKWHIGYTVSFDGNSGTPSKTSMITGGDKKLSSLPTGTRTGYALKGWYTDKTGGTQITTSTVFGANTTVYAQWTVQNYNVYAGKYTGGSYGKAYWSQNGSNWTEITSTSKITLGTFPSNSTIYFKMVPNSGYYSHPYVEKASGSYYAPTIYNYVFSVSVTEPLNIKLNFTTTPPTGDTSVWQYVVAAFSSAGIGAGAFIGYKKKNRK